MEKPPEKPPLLYQYRPPKPWAFYNLLRGVVRYSPRRKLNDPCELLIKPSLCGLTSADYEKLREDRPDLFEGVPEGIEEFIAYHNETLDKAHTDARRAWRVSCFSECKHNLLMWSHYAGGGKGFCLEFNTAEDQLFQVVAKMAYRKTWTNALDAVEILKQDGKTPNVYQGPLAHKPFEWRHEKEWRVLDRSPAVIPDDILSDAPENRSVFQQKDYKKGVDVLCKSAGCRMPPAGSASTADDSVILLTSEEKGYSPETLKAIYLGLQTGADAEQDTEKQIRAIIEEKYPHAELWYGYLIDDKYKMGFAPANKAAHDAAHAAR